MVSDGEQVTEPEVHETGALTYCGLASLGQLVAESMVIAFPDVPEQPSTQINVARERRVIE